MSMTMIAEHKIRHLPRGLMHLIDRLQTYQVDRWRRPGDYGSGTDSIFCTNRKRMPLEDADVVSSRAKTYGGTPQLDPETATHFPIFDLDVPAYLVPSSTPGHSHLYVDKRVSWRQYRKVLKAMSKAGIIDEAYYEATVGAKAAFLRLPWIKREDVTRAP
jgi:hypothetical protein